MDWADLDLPYLLIRPLTNLQFKEGLRICYSDTERQAQPPLQKLISNPFR